MTRHGTNRTKRQPSVFTLHTIPRYVWRLYLKAFITLTLKKKLRVIFPLYQSLFSETVIYKYRYLQIMVTTLYIS